MNDNSSFEEEIVLSKPSDVFTFLGLVSTIDFTLVGDKAWD